MHKPLLQETSSKEEIESKKVRLLSALRLINGNAKSPLKFVEHTKNMFSALSTLLKFVEEQCGGLIRFLEIWIYREEKGQFESNTLKEFLKNYSEDCAIQETEKVVTEVVGQLEQHLAGVSTQILQICKELCVKKETMKVEERREER